MFAKLVLVVNVLVQVYGFDEPLMAQSVLYGVSYLTQEDANSSLCHQELFHLFKSVETHHPWALKGTNKVLFKSREIKSNQIMYSCFWTLPPLQFHSSTV
jgi:hypothetical protein